VGVGEQALPPTAQLGEALVRVGPVEVVPAGLEQTLQVDLPGLQVTALLLEPGEGLVPGGELCPCLVELLAPQLEQGRGVGADDPAGPVLEAEAVVLDVMVAALDLAGAGEGPLVPGEVAHVLDEDVRVAAPEAPAQ